MLTDFSYAPSYVYREGEVNGMTREQLLKAAKRGPWPNGYASYLAELEAWWSEGTMSGLEVTYV